MDHISKYTHMDTGSYNQNFKLLGAFVVGAFVGSFSIWMWTATQDALVDKGSELESVIQEEIVEEQSVIAQDLGSIEKVQNNAIVVRDQEAGSVVVIEKANLEEDGWVVIHEGTASHIGNALGAARFDKGEHSGVVELLRSTELGGMYRAVLYRDNGDKEFNLDTDFPFLQSGNQPILTTFTVK